MIAIHKLCKAFDNKAGLWLKMLIDSIFNQWGGEQPPRFYILFKYGIYS